MDWGTLLKFSFVDPSSLITPRLFRFGAMPFCDSDKSVMLNITDLLLGVKSCNVREAKGFEADEKSVAL